MVYPSISPLSRLLPKTVRALSEVIHDIAPRFGWEGDALGMLEANPEIAMGIAAAQASGGISMAKRFAREAFREGNKVKRRLMPYKRPPLSQLPAQPKGDMPFGNKRSREWNDIQQRVKFPRRSSMKRNNAITGHYRKSKRRKRIQDPRGVINVYDDHDLFTADNAMYLYAQDFGSSDRALLIGVQAIVKAALATLHIYPSSPKYLITTGSPDNELQINFRRTSGVDPSHESHSDQVTVNNVTFEVVCANLFVFFKANAQVGYYPFSFRFEGGDRGNEYRSLGDSIITMTASTTWQIQNTTVSDERTDDRSAFNTTSNPLKGKIYRTRGFVPYVRPGIVRDQTAAVGFHESPAEGISRPVAIGDDNYMNHPPVGTTFFRHCTSSQNVKLQAGSIMPIRSYFRTKMTIINFFKNVIVGEAHGEAQQPNMFGTCTVLALEQAMRSVGDESVRVGVNREITMKAHVRLKTKVPTIHSYKSTGVLDGS